MKDAAANNGTAATALTTPLVRSGVKGFLGVAVALALILLGGRLFGAVDEDVRRSISEALVGGTVAAVGMAAAVWVFRSRVPKVGDDRDTLRCQISSITAVAANVAVMEQATVVPVGERLMNSPFARDYVQVVAEVGAHALPVADERALGKVLDWYLFEYAFSFPSQDRPLVEAIADRASGSRSFLYFDPRLWRFTAGEDLDVLTRFVYYGASKQAFLIFSEYQRTWCESERGYAKLREDSEQATKTVPRRPFSRYCIPILKHEGARSVLELEFPGAVWLSPEQLEQVLAAHHGVDY